MQLSRRRLVPGELDHELIGLSVSLSLLTLAAAWLGIGLPWPRCLFHDLTGFPCVTCGMTRSAIEFFHGHFLAALRWNPLIFSAMCALSIFNGYALVVLIVRGPRLRIGHITAAEGNLIRSAIAALLVLNWIYLLVANPGI